MVADARAIAATVGDTPSFVWLHFMDPHGPYFPPESVRGRFADAAYAWPGDHPLAVAPTNFGLGVIPAYQAVAGETAPASYRARYDAEIRYVDDHVAAVLAAYRAHGLLERTLVVVTADHGESLGDHDYYFAHGWFAYEDALRVPLVLVGPGVPAGRRVGASVSLVDLAPTLLDLLGLPATATMEGRSLRPLVRADGSDREAFSQTYYGEGMVALRTGDVKYVFKPKRVGAGARPGSDPPFADASEEWLFDLTTDPGETKNLAPGDPRLATYRGRTQAWLTEQERRGHGRQAEQQRAHGTATRVIGDPQLERQLRALGYVE
jgi:arylsulfatase A-like enzyme